MKNIRRFRIPNSEFRNLLIPHSAFRIPHSGISLTEVLISMGLLAIGLLGVAAMFPVGSYYMLRGEISDRGASAAHAAFADVVSRGILQPESWYMGTTTTAWNETLPQRFRNATAQQLAAPHASWGSVYAIDPLGVMSAPPNYPAAVVAQMPIVNTYTFTCLTPSSPSWQPWNLNPSGTKRYPIRRVSVLPMVWSSSSNDTTRAQENARAQLVAEQLFLNQDDLSIELPEQEDRPGQVRWDATGTTRAYDGRFSWLVTIAPTSFAATHGLWSGNPGAALYDITVAVFHRRQLGEVAAERQVRAAVVTPSTSGGQLLLTRFPNPPSGQDTSTQTPFEHMKVGQYITLYGPHPQGNNEQPFLFFQWYKVVAIEGEGQHLDELGDPQSSPQALDRRIVTLHGPDWPWQPANNLADMLQLSNDLRVGIYAGAVAVHTKTMRLAGGSNSGSPWTLPGTTRPGTPDKPWAPY